MNRLVRLWWLAQIERGVEQADIDREPLLGSDIVLLELARQQRLLIGRKSGRYQGKQEYVPIRFVYER